MKNKRTGKSYSQSPRKQPVKTSSPHPPVKAEDHKVKWFNIVFGLLLIGGMLLSALGGRARVSRGVSAAVTASPASVAFTWQNKSAAGACEQVTAYANGHFQSGPCGKTASDRVLTSSIAKQLQTWLSTYQSFAYQPSTQNGQTAIALDFHGSGQRAATTEEQLAIENLAETLAMQN